jgi:hypothetical protein
MQRYHESREIRNVAGLQIPYRSNSSGKEQSRRCHLFESGIAPLRSE